MKIEQYCKRRKERQKAETAGISFLRFCLIPCHGTCHRRDAAEKRKSAEHTSAQVKKKSHQKAVRTVRRKNRQGRGKLPLLYAAVRVRRRSCRAGISPIRCRADHRTLAEPSAAEFSSMVSATALLEQGAFIPCGFVLTSHK